MTIHGAIPPEYQNVTDTNIVKMTQQEAIQEAIHEIELMEQMECACPDCERRRPALQMAIEALQFQQSVVRCKDCIHQYKDEKLNGLYCALMTTVNIKIIADNDEYCSAGERRDEE